MWAATSSGIYRSADFGSTWTLASDGIPESATTLAVFPDGKIPTIYYAATASDGLYRTINGGVTWQPLDPKDFDGGTIRGIQEFSGETQTRLYAATSNGLWVATVPNVTLPGPLGSIQVPGEVVWRPVTQAGLGNNTIMWALSSFTTTPGTLFAGTQSNGGYSLTFQPPVNEEPPSWLAAGLVKLTVGTDLVATEGEWSGTPQIDYTYQWQRCTTSGGGCANIEDPNDGSVGTSKLYTIQAADKGKYLRVAVTATNDFPEPVKQLHTAYSEIRGPVEKALGPLPGENQQQAPAIVDISPGAEQGLPTEGDTLSAPAGGPGESGWYFNPVAAGNTISYHWLRCDENGENCARIAEAKNQTYVLAPEDDGLALRVEVAGTNENGTTTLPLSGPTNPIVPLPAASTSPPTLAGHPYVGSTLVGGVGAWRSPATFYERRWEACEPDGSACSPIQGATSPEYTVGSEDFEKRLRMAVIADVNPSDQLPLAIEAYTPLSEPIAYPPGVTPPPRPVLGGGSSGGNVGPVPIVATPAPALQALSLGSARIRAGGALRLRYQLSAPASLSVAIARLSAGHRSGRACHAGRHGRRAARCTLARTVETVTLPNLSGAGTATVALKVGGRKLPPGSYRATITPIGAGGVHGASRVLLFAVPKHR